MKAKERESGPRGVLVVLGERALEAASRHVEGLLRSLGGLATVLRFHLVPGQGEETGVLVPGLAEFEPPETFPSEKLVLVASSPAAPAAPGAPRTRVGFLEKVVAVAADEDVELIVLLGVAEEQLAFITELAHVSRRPVLLARVAVPGLPLVIVATSLTDDNLPTVSYGVDLGRRLGATVKLLHNAPHAGGEEPPQRVDARSALVAQAARSAAEPGLRVDALFTSHASAEEAILDVAAVQRPTLVVLGSYPRSWLTGVLAPSVCEAVAANSPVSVVILPLCCELA